MPKLIQKSSDLSQNGLANLFPRKRTVASLPKPKKVKCFQCQTNFYIKYVVPN